jgi:cytochrome P450
MHQEGLQCWPPAASLIYKVAPPEGDTYNGKFIPGGTNIAYSTWATQHNREIYCADADIFRPERRLEADGQKLHDRTRSAELVLGCGQHGCLGKTVVC